MGTDPRSLWGQTPGKSKLMGTDPEKGYEMKMKVVVFGALVAGFACGGLAEEPSPWSHRRYLDDPEEFHFAIVPDRQGADRDSKMSEYRHGFEKAIRAVNMLRPEFVMSIGDIIPAGWLKEERVREQYRDAKELLSKFEPPFFWVVGNHDIAPSMKRAGFERCNEVSTKVWGEFNGTNTYSSFIYKGVLFIALNGIDNITLEAKHRGISETQYNWFANVLEAHPDVRWTCIFMHQPAIWTHPRWLEFEKAHLVKRKYTVFCGDWHQYLHVRRHGHDYYVLATAGGAGSLAGADFSKRATLLGPKYGELDHITWVTMTKDKGPVIANIDVNAVLPHDFVSQQTTLSPGSVAYTLDYPPVPGTTERLRKLKDETDVDALFKEREEDLKRRAKWDELPKQGE